MLLMLHESRTCDNVYITVLVWQSCCC